MKTGVLIVGGGLAGGLAALALAARRPGVTVTLVDRAETIGGNHVWSFFDSDIADADRDIVAPLICHRWEGYDIAFPGYARTLGGTYNTIESERLDAAVRAALPAERVLTGVEVAAIDPAGATLADGRRIDAAGVIDARGFTGAHKLDLGWQKFMGLLLRLEEPHGLARPVIMDAGVDQIDGYRFVYLLPFGEKRIFVEDTYYTSEAELDQALLAERIKAYTRERGWQVAAIEREEAAALPIAMGGDPSRLWDDAPTARLGMAAGLFHPMTGY